MFAAWLRFFASQNFGTAEPETTIENKHFLYVAHFLGRQKASFGGIVFSFRSPETIVSVGSFGHDSFRKDSVQKDPCLEDSLGDHSFREDSMPLVR